MSARFLKFWLNLRASYWFIPSLMALGAIVLALLLPTLDAYFGSAWIYKVDLLYANRPQGARALLSTIAGSMITVAGVTFSITIAALAYATSQYGPRLLTNFMEDAGNQYTLGTFIATFLYCLLVLRTIRSAEDSPPEGIAQDAEVLSMFVPHLSILFGLVLALASIGVLIYFIHHVTNSIHASHLVARIGHELHGRTGRLFPERLGREHPADEGKRVEIPTRFFEEAAAVRSQGRGYVQYLDNKRLIELATRHDLVLRIAYRPGDFVGSDKVLLYAWPAERVDDTLCRKLHETFAWGNRRTHVQDVSFLINELVEIAARALSPGVNDPFTAMSCLDWLGSALSDLGERSFPDAHRYDEDGALRVIAHPYSFADFASAAFDQLRPYAAADRNAALHMMKTIGEAGSGLQSVGARAILATHAAVLKEAADQILTHQRDLDALAHRYQVVTQLLRDPARRPQLLDAEPWLGGGA